MSRKLKPRIWQTTFLINHHLKRSIKRQAATYFGRDRTPRVLDVGCGSMPYRPLFADRVETYTGCDLYPSEEGVVQCPAEALAFEDASVDGVVCFEVIEHVLDPDAVIGEIARVLKPGGTALVTVPFMFPYHGSPADYYRYTHLGLRHLLEKHGLTVKEVDPQCPTISTIFMMFNIWVADILGFGMGIRPLRPILQLIGAIVYTPVNLIGWLLGLADPSGVRRGFPGFANYGAIAVKP